jgi:signal transduction histidine kinase
VRLPGGDFLRLETRSRWLELLALTRLLGGLVAVILISAHRITDYDDVLVGVTIAWTLASIALFVGFARLEREPLAWLVDGGVALVLIWLSGDWRSPFYILALTALILPATALPFRRALGWGLAWTAGYFLVAVFTERLGAEVLQRTISVETVATHMMVPMVVVLALAYAAEVLRRLGRERELTERMAVQSERQRIAWELHDSAKQRVHAAHLLLTAVADRVGDSHQDLLEPALAELRAATADMDTSVAELRAPLDGRPVDKLLRERAHSLALASDASLEVTGSLPPLPPLVATHGYRIAAEALTNAVRHSGARRIAVEMRDGEQATIVVRDDGIGLPRVTRPGSNGLRSMRARAETIGASLRIESLNGGSGTVVTLELPSTNSGAP